MQTFLSVCIQTTNKDSYLRIMGITDIPKAAPQLLILYIITAVLLVAMIITYSIQASQINYKGDSTVGNRAGSATCVIGIVMTLVAFLWIFFYISFVNAVRNIGMDPSTMYVSRYNIVANWYNPTTAPPSSTIGPNTDPISSEARKDTNVCFLNFGAAKNPTAYEGYEKLLTAYGTQGATGIGVTQYYKVPTPSGSAIKTVTDTLERQQANTLAYYRYTYCFKSYMEDIYNEKWESVAGFLPDAIDGLKSGRSCLDKNLSTAQSKIPDTTKCLNADWLTTLQCDQNPCFTALTESVSAQCLLHDDHVFAAQHSGTPAGALVAFGIEPIQVV